MKPGPAPLRLGPQDETRLTNSVRRDAAYTFRETRPKALTSTEARRSRFKARLIDSVRLNPQRRPRAPES